MRFEYDERKFTELVMLVAERLRDDRACDAARLETVLFLVDFAHMRRHGRPVTGADYQKLPQGPAPRGFGPVRDSLVRGGEAGIVVDDRHGYAMHRLVPRRPARIDLFSESELETVDEVLLDLTRLTATQVSDLCHADAGLRLAEDGATIPYHMAFVPRTQLVTPTAIELAKDVAEQYGLTG